MPERLSHRLARSIPILGGLLAALGAAPPAIAQQVEAGQAPAAWIAYARTVSTAVQARLEAADPVAIRLHAYLDQLPSAGRPEGATLRIAFWVDAAGKITRIDHAPFAQAQPNDDLQTLVVGMSVSKAPPKGMISPIRLTIRLDPAPAAIDPANVPRNQVRTSTAS